MVSAIWRLLGGGGVPAAGVSAVLVNVTTTNATSLSSYLTIYQTGITRPTTSTINFRQGVNVANQALVRVGADGTISIFNAGGSVDVIIDVEGWVGVDDTTPDAKVTTTPPARILDTRATLGGHHGAVAAGDTVRVPVLGVGAVPSSGVAAVVAHVVAVNATGAGYLTVFPWGYSMPTASTLNFPAGTAVGNTITVPVGPDGAIAVYNVGKNPNVVVDIEGWIAAPDLSAVTPPLSSALDAGQLTGTDARLATRMLTNANVYAMTTWWSSADAAEHAAHVDAELERRAAPPLHGGVQPRDLARHRHLRPDRDRRPHRRGDGARDHADRKARLDARHQTRSADGGSTGRPRCGARTRARPRGCSGRICRPGRTPRSSA